MNTIQTSRYCFRWMIALSACMALSAHAQETIVDNTGAQFSVTGTWSPSTAISGYYGSNYLTHEPGTEYVGGIVLDNGGGGTQATGTWNNSTAISGYVGSDYLTVPSGTGQNVYTWNIGSQLPQAGNYKLYARWSAYPNRATNATYTINVAGTISTVTVNQQQNGGQWYLLGSYALTPNQVSVSLSDQANGYVIADAIEAIPDGAPTAAAQWTPQVTQAGYYNVYARWSAYPNRATNAPYTVVGMDGPTTVQVNQQQGGGQWFLLGNYKLNTSSVIRLGSDNTNGYAIADSIRVVLTQTLPTTPQIYYIQADTLNTPRLITDGQNNTVWRNLPTTEPFGNSPPETDPNSTGTPFQFNLRFPGQYADQETNTNYNYFRDYDPNTGRYIQSDPIGLRGGSVSTYVYVNGNPILRIDLWGLQYAGGLTSSPFVPMINPAWQDVFNNIGNLPIPAPSLPGDYPGVNVPPSVPIVPVPGKPVCRVVCPDSGNQCRPISNNAFPSIRNPGCYEVCDEHAVSSF
jgi:RHS repeat-associated protein